MKQTRNRSKRPIVPLGVETLESWQGDPSNVKWAQENDGFRRAVTVVINERSKAHVCQPGESENCRLGRVQGYELAIEVLKELATLPQTPPKPPGQPTYERPEEYGEETVSEA